MYHVLYTYPGEVLIHNRRGDYKHYNESCSARQLPVMQDTSTFIPLPHMSGIHYHLSTSAVNTCREFCGLDMTFRPSLKVRPHHIRTGDQITPLCRVVSPQPYRNDKHTTSNSCTYVRTYRNDKHTTVDSCMYIRMYRNDKHNCQQLCVCTYRNDKHTIVDNCMHVQEWQTHNC